jgi:hypothetical protein
MGENARLGFWVLKRQKTPLLGVILGVLFGSIPGFWDLTGEFVKSLLIINYQTFGNPVLFFVFKHYFNVILYGPIYSSGRFWR